MNSRSHSNSGRAGAMRRRLGLTLAFMAFLGSTARVADAAVIEAWVHRHRNAPDSANCSPFKALLDTAGNVIVVGSSLLYPDAWSIEILKYSGATGSVLWRQSYGPAFESANEGVEGVKLDGNNNVVLIGYSDPGTGPLDCFTAKFSGNDGALLWENHRSLPSPGLGNRTLAVDYAGDVIVAIPSPLDPEWNEGSIAFCAFKYAAGDGALLWEKCHPGPGGRPYYLEAIAVDAIGNVVMTGSSVGEEATHPYDIHTAKYSATSGALLWEKRYNGPAKKDDMPRAVAVDGSGDVIVTGVSSNGDSEDHNWDVYTAKYSSADGALLWERRYNGPADRSDQGIAVTVDIQGNVIVTGASDNGAPRFDSDVYTAKYSAADGALLWEKRHDGPGNSLDGPAGIAVDTSGNVMMTASSESGRNNSDIYTVKYAAADGALLWEQYFDGPAGGNDHPASVAADASGNVVVTGVADTTRLSVDSEMYTAKYASADGALLWDEFYDGAPSYGTSAKAVVVDAVGNVIVTGSAFNPTTDDAEIYTAKYAAADGRLLWEAHYNDNADDEPTAVALDAEGNVVVTGWTAVTGGHDFYTAKYAAADGSLLWETFYNGPANRFDLARAVAVDASGNVVVAGDSWNGTNGDIQVVKYAAEDGNVLWERRYSGPATDSEHDDRAIAVAVDGNGDIILGGESETNNGEEYYIAKYAGADGALLWERHHNNPDAYDELASLAVDGGGNVVVTGNAGTIKYLADGTAAWTNTVILGKAVAVDLEGNILIAGSRSNTNGNSDVYTARIAAIDGSMLWERCDNGPVNGDDFASAVAVDTCGNVVITGGSSNGTNNDYYTAKYAAADGGLLWEKRYNGPGNREDNTAYSHGLALGPNGMVAITGRSDNLDGKTDIATVVYRENLPPVSLSQATGGITLRFAGVPGQRYKIERAPTVSGPWTTIATLTAPAGGQIHYTDAISSSGSIFYRTAQQ